MAKMRAAMAAVLVMEKEGISQAFAFRAPAIQSAVCRVCGPSRGSNRPTCLARHVAGCFAHG